MNIINKIIVRFFGGKSAAKPQLLVVAEQPLPTNNDKNDALKAAQAQVDTWGMIAAGLRGNEDEAPRY